MEEIERYLDLTVLEDFKEYLYRLLDERTTNNIFKGFNFDGQVFSMSLSAQINLSNLFNIPESSFPLPYSTKDNGIYTLTFENRQNFYLSALSFKNNCIQEANTLKNQIKNSLTISELQDILDNL